MPLFPKVESTAGLPASAPVTTPSPAAFGGLEAQSLARLGGTLTELGVEREREATRFRRTSEVTGHETRLHESIATWQQGLARETDPDAIRASRDAFFTGLEGQITEIPDRVVQETVRKSVATWALAAKVDAGGRIFTLEADRVNATGEAALDLLARRATEAPDAPTRAYAEAQFRVTGEALVQGGTRTALWWQDRLEKGEATIAKGRTALLIEANPTEAVAVLSDQTSDLRQQLGPIEGPAALEKAKTKAKQDREGVVRTASQQIAGPIIDEFRSGQRLTLESGLADAERQAGADVETADAAKVRVKAGFAEHQVSETAARQVRALAAFVLVETTKSTDSIPRKDWYDLDPGHRDALRKLETDLQRGKVPETDWAVYYDLTTQASSTALQDQFLQTDLLAKYGTKLAPQHLKEVIDLQARLRAKDGSAEATLDGYRTNAQIVNDGLAGVGIDPTPRAGDTTTAKKVAQFRRLVDERVAGWKRQTGKPEIPTGEVQAIVDDLLKKGQVPGTGYFWNDRKHAFELGPGETLVLDDVAAIPPRDRALIAADLVKRGQPVTDAAVLTRYNQFLKAGGR